MLIVIIIVGVIIILAILAHAASNGGATGRLWSATTRIVTCAGFVNGGIEKALLLWDSAHSLNLTWQEHRTNVAGSARQTANCAVETSLGHPHASTTTQFSA